jgi:hypothetical protein
MSSAFYRRERERERERERDRDHSPDDLAHVSGVVLFNMNFMSKKIEISFE